MVAPLQSIPIGRGSGWTRMGALDELGDLPGCGQSHPIASLGAETKVSVFAGVAEKIDQQ